MTEQPGAYRAAISPTIIGVDPGLKGAIAILKNGSITARPLPLAGKDLDLVTLAQWLREATPQLAVIEKVHSMPGQGVSSTFKFGTGYGGILGVCAALAIPVELVTPQAWKKAVLAGTAKDKDAAISYCRRVFPQVALIPPGCRKHSDGIADALCLLEFGQREYLRTIEGEAA